MADVEMTDAPVKTAKAGTDTAIDGKKRFEVKKVEQRERTRYGKEEADNFFSGTPWRSGRGTL